MRLSLIYPILPALVFLIVSEIILHQHDNIYSIKKEILEKYKDDAEVLILGSSQAFMGIDPQALSRKAINMANFSQSLTLDCKLAEKLLPQMPKIKYLLFSFHHFTLHRYLIHDEAWRNEFYIKFFGVGEKQYDEFWLSPKSWLLTTLYGPARSWDIISNYPNDTISYDISDYGLNKVSEGFNNDEEAVGRNNSYARDYSAEQNINALKKTLELIEAKKITPVFIVTPVTNDYRKQMDEKQWQADLAELQKLITPAQGIIMNYLDNPHFSKDDFVDSFHPNYNGAQKLSQLINQDLQWKKD